MGCSQSKAAQVDVSKQQQQEKENATPALHALLSGISADNAPQTWAKITALCHSSPDEASAVHDGQTPLHVACQKIGIGGAPSLDAIRSLIRAAPSMVEAEDADGHLPLHYVLIPVSSGKEAINADANGGNNSNDKEDGTSGDEILVWRDRAQVMSALTSAAPEESTDYLSRVDLIFDEDSMPRTALYQAVRIIPDDFSSSPGPTVEFIRSIHEANPTMATMGSSDELGDRPLSLLYRRFSRQFDLSEKFFPGDNSRPEVVSYRQRYKASAMNTWRIINLLLRPSVPAGSPPIEFKMVHSAVQVDCPPDLLRYIIETKTAQVLEPEPGTGRLPLHCAAAAMPKKDRSGNAVAFPAYLSKFIVDELLYASPEAASTPDGDGKLPLNLAIDCGKSWIGGGIKSLVDADPDSLEKIDLDQHPEIRKAISFSSQFPSPSPTPSDVSDEEKESTIEGGNKTIKKEEHHDAVMLVQKSDANIRDIVSCMWASEEDGAVQMLGCLAISRRAKELPTETNPKLVAIAANALSSIVNAMKNHPNEPGIQEKACECLLALSPADGQSEISFAASGAVASIVAAMQSHVSDPIVQKEACRALRTITKFGGKERATIIASVSGLQALLNSLLSHPDDSTVQREACLAMEAIIQHKDDANLPALSSLQVAPLLQLAAETHPAECKESAEAILKRLDNAVSGDS